MMKKGKKGKEKQLGDSTRMAANGASTGHADETITETPEPKPVPPTPVEEAPTTAEVAEEANVELVGEPVEAAEVTDEAQIDTNDTESSEGETDEAEEEQEPSPQTKVLDFLGYMLKCCYCKTVIETIGEVCIPSGQAPDKRLNRGMYKAHCLEHVKPIEEALKLSGTGCVVGLLEARKSARNFFRNLSNGSMCGRGCIKCGHEDPGEGEWYLRNVVISGLPHELAHDKSLEVLIGKELCEFHSRSAKRIDIPLQRFDDWQRRKRVDEAFEQKDPEEYKRQINNLVEKYLGPNAVKKTNGNGSQRDNEEARAK